MYSLSELEPIRCDMRDLYLLEPYSLSCKYLKSYRLDMLFGYCEDMPCFISDTIETIISPPGFPIYFKYKATRMTKYYIEKFLNALDVQQPVKRLYERFLSSLFLLEANIHKPYSEMPFFKTLFLRNVKKRGITTDSSGRV